MLNNHQQPLRQSTHPSLSMNDQLEQTGSPHTISPKNQKKHGSDLGPCVLQPRPVPQPMSQMQKGFTFQSSFALDCVLANLHAGSSESMTQGPNDKADQEVSKENDTGLHKLYSECLKFMEGNCIILVNHDYDWEIHKKHQ